MPSISQSNNETLKTNNSADNIENILKKYAAKISATASQPPEQSANAAAFCVAYEQCKIAFFSKHKKSFTDGKVSDEQLKVADKVRKNKPAGLAEMTIAASENGVNLKLVDDPKYVKTDEDKANGEEIVFIERGATGDQVGHAYYMDMNGKLVDVLTKPNDCFYGVMSVILKNKGVDKSIKMLRNEIADNIKWNANFFKVIQAEQWVYSRYPQQANMLLFNAGLKLAKFNGKLRLIVEEKDLNELDRSIKDEGRDKCFQEDFKVNI